MYRFITGDYRGALALAGKLCALAAKSSDPSDALIGGRLIGAVLHILGDQAGARRRVEPLGRADFSSARRSQIIRDQFNQRVVTHSYYARILWLQGFADQAMRIAEDLVDYARTTNHMTSVFHGLVQAACPIALYAGNLPAAEHFVKLTVDLSVRYALEAWSVWGQCFEGVLLMKRGDSAGGSQLLRTALTRFPEAAFHLHTIPCRAGRGAWRCGAGCARRCGHRRCPCPRRAHGRALAVCEAAAEEGRASPVAG